MIWVRCARRCTPLIQPPNRRPRTIDTEALHAMSDTLRDQLLGLGFKTLPKPERKPDARRDGRPQGKPGPAAGKPSHTGKPGQGRPQAGRPQPQGKPNPGR